jgi:type IV fimbrial biogenesis protein FimT
MQEMCYMRKNLGFTLVELMIGVAIVGILAAVAAPAVINWLPNYRLNIAARDLHSNMQKAKLQAVKENNNITVRFDASVIPGFYYFDTNGDAAYTNGEFRIELKNYHNDVDFGTGNAPSNWNGDPCVQASVITFNSRGTANSGSIYFDNKIDDPNNSICNAITVRSNGSIKMRKYRANWTQ